MIEFRSALRDRLLELATEWVGPTSGMPQPVVSFDDHLYSLPITSLPFIVANVRTYEVQTSETEIGNDFELKIWDAHIYYLDMATTYSEGDDRRNTITAMLEKRLKQNRRLGHLEFIDSEGTREYVYDLKVTSATFDSSGQEGEYSFVTELYLQVYTACQ